MATVKRHPVPMEFYEPERPLNDLRECQLKHFVHVAARLPVEHRVHLAAPSADDGLAATRFIGAVTAKLLELKRPQLLQGGRPKVKTTPRKGARPGDVGAIAAKAAAKKTAAKKTDAKKTVVGKRAVGTSKKSPAKKAGSDR